LGGISQHINAAVNIIMAIILDVARLTVFNGRLINILTVTRRSTGRRKKQQFVPLGTFLRKPKAPRADPPASSAKPSPFQNLI
jgi:hypothetical protein